MRADDVTRAELAVHSEAVACPDGLTMKLDVYRPAAAHGAWPLTVICHGFKGFRTWGMFPFVAQELAATGRAVALFDLSHNGTQDVDGEFTRLDLFREQTVSRHVADVGTIVDTLTSARLVDACRLDLDGGVHLVGHSMGGGVSLLAAAGDGRIRSVASLNGVSHYRRVTAEGLEELAATGQIVFPNARTGQDMPLGRAWFDDAEGIDMEARCGTLDLPVLIVHATDDESVPVREGELLAAWVPGARMVRIEDTGHTFGARHPWAGWTDGLRVAVRELDDFLPRGVL